MPFRGPLLLAPALLLALAACGSSGGGEGGSGGSGAAGTGGSGTGSSATGTGGSSTSSTTATTGTGGSTIDCGSATNPTFPTFDKGCQTSSECLVKLHQIDCCGTLVSIGVAVTQNAAFDAAEAQCESQYPGCGCAAEPTKAEDGKTAADESQIQVQCTAGECTTYVP